MSRFLFVVPPLTGHANPAAAVGEALAARGHEVAWAGPESFLRPLLGPDVPVFRTGLRMYRPLGDRGKSDAQSFLDDYVVPLARFTRAAVEKAVAGFDPDLLVVDQHALAASILAQRDGRRWASLLPTALGLVRPGALPAEITAWIHGPVAKLCADSGWPVSTEDELLAVLWSKYLQIAFTTPDLTGPVTLPPAVKLIGPALARRPNDPEFPLEWLRPDRRHLLVTMGTLTVDTDDFYRRVVTALEPLADRVQAILLAPPELLPDPPAHIAVRPRTRFPHLMPHLDAVVGHAGVHTCAEALTHALPLVLAPITLDQPLTAAQVTRAGAGVEVPFASATPEQLRAAILTVLDNPAYAAAAARLRDAFAAAGGAAAGARHLEELARA